MFGLLWCGLGSLRFRIERGAWLWVKVQVHDLALDRAC